MSGAQQLKQYVLDNNLWIDECGKILLPTSSESIASLDLLLDRAKLNGVDARKIYTEEILDLEPNANPVYGCGLHVPFTSVVDPKEVVSSLTMNVKKSGVSIRYDSRVTGVNSESGIVQVGKDVYTGTQIINSAGLHADNIADIAQLRTNFSFLPFKGKYWRINKHIQMKTLVYPIPNLNLPFLGVHTVHNQAGKVYVGPSSTPVFGRENYYGLRGLSFLEFWYLIISFTWKFIANTNGLRKLGMREMHLLFPKGIYKESRRLINNIEDGDLTLAREKVGIRSQIFDKEQDQLVTDFVIIKKNRVIHILNAISPAFTASFGLADLILDEYLN